MPTSERTFTLEFPYRRTIGPVVGAFFSALQERRVLGSRTAGGRVLVPPLEYDPETGDAIVDLVEVEARGTVHEWAWVEQPLRHHPLSRPFAWALVQLDGADTRMLHALDVASADAVHTGMRVRVRWRTEPAGGIGDIECFEPDEGEA